MNERRDAILEQRAQVLAKEHELQTQHLRGNETVIVDAGSLRLGIGIGALREIVPTGEITVLPGVPQWMLGLVQLRGELLAVIDVGVWWNLAGAATRTSIAVVEGDRGALGIAIDAVLEMRRIEDDELDEGLSAEASSRRPSVRGVTHDLIHILDV